MHISRRLECSPHTRAPPKYVHTQNIRIAHTSGRDKGLLSAENVHINAPHMRVRRDIHENAHFASVFDAALLFASSSASSSSSSYSCFSFFVEIYRAPPPPPSYKHNLCSYVHVICMWQQPLTQSHFFSSMRHASFLCVFFVTLLFFAILSF